LEAVLRARLGQPMEAVLAEAYAGLSDATSARDRVELWLLEAAAHRERGAIADALAGLARVMHYADEVGSADLRTRASRLREVLESSVVVDASDAQRAERLRDVVSEIAMEDDPAAILSTVASAALDLSDADRAAIVLRDQEAPAAHAGQPVDPEALVRLVAPVLESGRPLVVADLGQRTDLRSSTSTILLQLRSVAVLPISHDGRIRGALYVDSQRASERDLERVMRDLRTLADLLGVTLARAEAESRLAEREHQAYGVAHDMRNLLSYVVAVAEDLARRMDTQELRDEVTSLIGVARELAGVGERFLKVDQAVVESFDLAALTSQLVGLLGYEARRRGIGFDVDGPATLEASGDAAEIRQALFNLFGNALKFSPAGGTICVRMGAEGDSAWWEIRDQGPGIPAELLERLAHRGVHGTHAAHGHGIGLSVVARAVARSGGTLSAANHGAGGAAFTLRLRAPRQGTG
jgi:signal transduction histidine kinase